MEMITAYKIADGRVFEDQRKAQFCEATNEFVDNEEVSYTEDQKDLFLDMLDDHTEIVFDFLRKAYPNQFQE